MKDVRNLAKDQVKSRLKKQLWRIPLFITVCASLPYFVAYLALEKPYKDMVQNVIQKDFGINWSFNWFWNIPLIFALAFLTRAIIIGVAWHNDAKFKSKNVNMHLPNSVIANVGIIIGLASGIITNFFLSDDPTLALKISSVLVSVLALIAILIPGLSGAGILLIFGIAGIVIATFAMIMAGILAFVFPLTVIILIHILAPKHAKARIFYWLSGKKKEKIVRGDIRI